VDKRFIRLERYFYGETSNVRDYETAGLVGKFNTEKWIWCPNESDQ